MTVSIQQAAQDIPRSDMREMGTYTCSRYHAITYKDECYDICPDSSCSMVNGRLCLAM